MTKQPVKQLGFGNWVAPDAAWLEEQHVTLGKSIKQIAQEVGAAPPRVRRWLKKARVLKKLRYTDTVAEVGAPKVKDNGYDWEPPSKEWLADKHLTQEIALFDIADEIGASQGTIQRWLKAYGLPARAYPRRKQTYKRR